jgi:hypothetical protein
VNEEVGDQIGVNVFDGKLVGGLPCRALANRKSRRNVSR